MNRSPSGQAGKSVAVYGAYGHTGRFIVTELLRRGMRPVLCGRDSTQLASLAASHPGLSFHAASVDDPRSLDAAFAGTAAVINAAGPFLDTGIPILEAALRAGIHYLDTSAEQRAAFAMFDQFAARARDAGIVAIPSIAFYGGLADLLATAALGDWPDAESITTAVGLDSWHPTRGTRITGERNHYRRWIIEQGELRDLPNPAPTTTWTFPEPFGQQEVVMLALTEIVAISRHIRCEQAHSYMNLAPLRDLRNPTTPPPVISPSTGHSGQMFVLDVQVTRKDKVRRAVAQGNDIYAVTAPLIAEALQRILEGAIPGPGVWAPGQAFNARDFLDSLAPEPLRVTIGEK